MAEITCIEDLRRLARKRVPRMFYDYVDGGSWTEYTYRANEEDFGKIEFRQRVAVDITERSTASTMVGQPVSMPVAIAPTGLTGMQHADGEILAARAAQRFGIPFTLSTMSICPIEAVAEATGRHPFWFQLYVLRDRSFVEGLIERAGNANCSADGAATPTCTRTSRSSGWQRCSTAPPPKNSNTSPTPTSTTNSTTSGWVVDRSRPRWTRGPGPHCNAVSTTATH